MEPTSLKRDISLRGPSRRNVYKLLDDAVFPSRIFPIAQSLLLAAAAVGRFVRVLLFYFFFFLADDDGMIQSDAPLQYQIEKDAV